MKIHQLPHGARFLFQGEEYVKTGPMLGSGKAGQKMFPRYVDLQPIDAPVAEQKKAEMLRREAVLNAFERFYRECRDLVDEDGNARLERARSEFLRTLD